MKYVTVDNFGTFPFDWSDPETFYFFQIINRKQSSGNNKGRCIKTYYVDTKEYLEKKISEMKALTDTNDGYRVYVHPARRSKGKIALELLQYVAECLVKNTLERLDRSYPTVCGRNLGIEKVWIVDVDNKEQSDIDETIAHIKTLRPYPDARFINPTVNGNHILYK